MIDDGDHVDSAPDSRIGRTPLKILCQHDHGSCAACCGAYNFVDRSPAASAARFRRRTDAVVAAWPDVDRLAAVRDELLAEERPQIVFAGVKVCPFAGYVEEPVDGPARVGCLLHPTRHPTGADLRDLAVYPKAVCAGHFCAPHDWLRPREVALAQTATGPRYGRVVTDAGLVKAVQRFVEDACGRRLDEDDWARVAGDLDVVWALFIDAWPYADPDPRRFGGFVFAGDDAVERTLPSALAGRRHDATATELTILDCLGTAVDDDAGAQAALSALRAALAPIVAALG
ncbi:MAG TPA: hypothetical protein VGF99_09410 [Myxococcota bacterium]